MKAKDKKEVLFTIMELLKKNYGIDNVNCYNYQICIPLQDSFDEVVIRVDYFSEIEDY